MAARPDSDRLHDGDKARGDDQHASRPTLPTPVAAALGVVVSGVRNARQLPTIATQLPIIGLGFAAQKAQTVRRGYLGYAARGMAFVQKMTGEAVDVGGFAVGLLKDRTPGASDNGLEETVREAQRSVEDEAREVAEKARDAVEKATQIRRSTTRPAGRKDAAGKPAAKRATPKPKPAAEQPEPAAAPELPAEAVEAGAPGAATAAAEEASQHVGPGVPSTAAEGSELSTDDLAIPDIDHLTLASLRARLRQLDVPQLVTLRAYELAHANRLQVVTMLENRIAKLEAEVQNPASGSQPGTASGSAAGSSAATSGASDGERAAQQAAEPAMRQAASGAKGLDATPRP